MGVATERSKTLLLVKNLDARATQAALAALVGKPGQLGTVLLVPGNTLALVEFLEVRFTHKPHKRKDARA